MSFNEGDPKNEQEEKKSVFSRVGNFFGWLGELIGEQARIDAQREEVEPPLHMMREITLQQQKTSEVIQNAETICTHLEEIKQRLSQEFGSSATCFISKCIDPMIDHAKYLTSALKQPAPHVNNILSQAIESVELYSQFSDERKLKKRIVQVAQGLIKQSIEKDLEVLANYKDDALAKCGWKNGEREENEFQLDGYLYPIISELIGMAGSQAETDDLHAFFVWKSTVDDRRNSLVELGFLTIDALTNAEENAVQIRHEEEDGEVVLEEPFPQLVKHQLEDSALAMSYISTLEDRVQDIFVRIEDIHFTDRGSIEQLEQLLEYLKIDSERFSKMGNHTKHVLNSFNSIKANILQAEGLLSKMKS